MWLPLFKADCIGDASCRGRSPSKDLVGSKRSVIPTSGAVSLSLHFIVALAAHKLWGCTHQADVKQYLRLRSAQADAT